MLYSASLTLCNLYLLKAGYLGMSMFVTIVCMQSYKLSRFSGPWGDTELASCQLGGLSHNISTN